MKLIRLNQGMTLTELIVATLVLTTLSSVFGGMFYFYKELWQLSEDEFDTIVQQQKATYLSNALAEGVSELSRKGGFGHYRMGIKTAERYEIRSYEGEKNAWLRLYGSMVGEDGYIRSSDEWEIDIKWSKKYNAIYIGYPGWSKYRSDDPKQGQKERKVGGLLYMSEVSECEFKPGIGEPDESLPDGFYFYKNNKEAFEKEFVTIWYVVGLEARTEYVRLRNTAHVNFPRI